MPTQVQVLFDQYSRYQAVGRCLSRLARPGQSVLDVGASVYRVLGLVTDDLQIHYLDPLYEGREEPDVLPCRLQDLSSDSAYDFVVAVDTLEHIPASDRLEFLQLLVARARYGVILANPFAEGGEAARVDAVVDDSYRAKTGEAFPWLGEHVEFGLPSLEDTRRFFESKGWQVGQVGNGHAPWLKQLLPFFIDLLGEPAHLPLLHEVSREFNETLIQYEHLTPSYRQVLVCSSSELGVDPRCCEEGLSESEEFRQEAATAWDRFWGYAMSKIASHMDELARQSVGTRLDRNELLRQATEEREKRSSLQAEAAALQDVVSQQGDELRRQTEKCKDLGAQLHELSLLHQKLREHFDVAEAERQRLNALVQGQRPGALALLGKAVRQPRKAVRRAVAISARKVYHALPQRLRYPAAKVVFRTFGKRLEHTLAGHQFRQLEKWHQQQADPASDVDGGNRSFGAPAAGCANVIAFGVIDWHFRHQRPQHLAESLADLGHNVFYVSPEFRIESEPGYHVEEIQRVRGAEHEGSRGQIFQIHLHVPRHYVIYTQIPPAEVATFLEASLVRLLAALGATPIATLIQHPAWYLLRRFLRRGPVLYDCMDYHFGFEVSLADLQQLETKLIEEADTVIVTSRGLEEMVGRQRTKQTLLVRNGADYEHFAVCPDDVFRDPQGRPVIGYCGAIAEWFDVDLVAEIARQLPNALILLVGADSAGVAERLRRYPNVHVVGEVPYSKVPYYVHGMTVSTVPFVLNSLTEATNPVKVYEHFAAGKPVVATAMPELVGDAFEGLVDIGTDHQSFVTAVRKHVEGAASGEEAALRRKFAGEQTWDKRAAAIAPRLLRADRGKVSIIVVTWNNISLTRQCVYSVLAHTYVDFELIFVDNGSTDGTQEFVAELESHDDRIQAICNNDNRGFAAANNQGIRAASGDYVVFLNNDTVVTPGWLSGLLQHVQADPTIGLVGPVTNNIGNEARVATSYDSVEEMPAEVAAMTAPKSGESFDIRACALFCALIPADLLAEVGELDEGFGLGFFEDDDLCQRVRAAGRRVVCAEDVFIHHELSASFDKVDSGTRRELFEKNRAYYESKWGPWQPHEYRE